MPRDDGARRESLSSLLPIYAFRSSVVVRTMILDHFGLSSFQVCLLPNASRRTVGRNKFESVAAQRINKGGQRETRRVCL